MKQRVFVYEHLSGGASIDEHDEADASLMLQGLAMRDAICADLAAIGNVSVTCASSAELAMGAALGGVEYLRPAPTQTPFEFVRQQSLAHDLCWVVAPECDGLLAHLSEIVGPERWIGCDTASIRLASSKRRTLELLAAQGLDTPLAFDGDQAVSRWVVKPDDGAGAVATRLHASLEAALGDAAGRSGEALVEPWVEGEALSLSLLCGPGEAETLCVNRQRIAVDEEGTVSFEGVDIDALRRGDPRLAALRQIGTRVAQALPGLRGYAGVDLVWHERRGPVVIEVNPRVTCAYVGLSAALGRSLGAEIVAMFARRQGHHVLA